MGKVSASLLEEIKGLSNKEAFDIYSKLFETIKSTEANIVQINPKDLEPKRTKRGSKNKK
jgi:hypothetical protein